MEVKSNVISLQALMGCEVSYGMQLFEKHSIIRYHHHVGSDDRLISGESKNRLLTRILTDLDSNYACIYGLSYALPEIAPGRAIAIYREKISILVFSGCEGKLVWFLFVDLEDPIPLAQGKSYTTKDLKAIYEEISDVDITPSVKFADIYNNKKAAVMAPLEEGIADVWYAGRLFLLGDAAHKVCQDDCEFVDYTF